MVVQSKKANFDASHELEELLLEDNPLKAKKRNEHQDFKTMAPDVREMEEQYVALGRRGHISLPRIY